MMEDCQVVPNAFSITQNITLNAYKERLNTECIERKYMNPRENQAR